VEALPDGADGLHLPEHGISTAEARRRYGEQILIGRSVHGIESALQAELDGADYLIAGTIFASNSHPGETPAGLDFLRAVCAAVRIPVIAIGGITPANAPDCIAAGAAGVAVLSPIMRAGDPRQVTEDYRRALGTRTCPP
jgi:thiamine-phosphate diphosphorylase